MHIGVGGFWGVVWGEDGRGERGQVIFTGTEVFRFPRVGERLGIQLGVAEHFLEVCLVEGTMSEGVNCVLRGGGGGVEGREPMG